MTTTDTITLPLTDPASAPLSRLDLEHAAIGAAVGAGCRPCLTHHLGVAREEGMEDDRIRWVLDTASQSLASARDSFGRHAAGLLGDDLSPEHPAEPVDGPLAALAALVGLGVAVGGNAVELARAHLDRLGSLGITERDRKRAVNLARTVQRTAGELTASGVAADDPGAQAAGSAGGSGCCGGPAPGPAADDSGTSGGGCCG
ncbi:MAG: carboxymuconolactone decarboxylase family protein [Nitriliruptoraceae bacterium]